MAVVEARLKLPDTLASLSSAISDQRSSLSGMSSLTSVCSLATLTRAGFSLSSAFLRATETHSRYQPQAQQQSSRQRRIKQTIMVTWLGAGFGFGFGFGFGLRLGLGVGVGVGVGVGLGLGVGLADDHGHHERLLVAAAVADRGIAGSAKHLFGDVSNRGHGRRGG